ncbi:MFS transporter [Butyrivibrio sp. XBB1001]|uniref:MFS transporter n=1 Tax=Butyrivibrio sp. XBB1001 TaxID=1280682 RepID=UPI00040941A5|nr:MFS transporter [Butyrivibrio sp. XBB1001]
MQTSKRERISYYLYFFGQNMFYMIIASYISLFLLNHGISEKVAASVIIAPQIWDVINDIIFGRIVDKCHLRGGKFMPWLKISWFLIPLTTVFIFCMPQGLSISAKCAWVIIGYCLWSVAYTMCDTPIFALSTAMTDKVDERNSILSIGRVTGTSGAVVATLAIESLYIGMGWKLLSISLSIVSMAMMLPILIFGKERSQVQTKSPTAKEMLRALSENKYLIIFYIAFFLVGLTNTVQTVIPTFAQYVLGDTEKGTLLLAMAIIPAIVVAAFIPVLSKKIDKFWLYIACLAIFVFSSVIQFFMGYGSFVALSITMALRGVGLVGYNVLVYMFTPDCVEYGQYVTGVRQEGITFSIQTCVTKLSAALMSSISLLLLALFGFKAINADAVTGIVDETGAYGCWNVLTWISAIGPVFAIIILVLGYKLRDNSVSLMALCNNGEITRQECDLRISELSRKG